MDACALEALTDIDTLRQMVRERDATIAANQRTLCERDALIGKLTYELKRLRRMQFAAKAERMDAVQRGLFDEAMAEDIAAVEAALEAAQAEGLAPASKAPRMKPTRRALPPELERVTTIHEPARCDCAACGAALVKMGEHTSEKLDVKPLVFFVRRDVYPQYACRACETIVAEPVAPAIISRGLAAPGLLAQVVIQKVVDHLPLYRQEAIFARHGIALKRTTLAEWMGWVGLALQPLFDALRTRLLTSPVLHADETPVAQLDPGAGKTKRAYLFVYRNTASHPIVLFDYGPTRAGKHAAAFLGDWKGALMVDDYAGYKALFAQGVTELGCWAHARRKFFDAHAASGSPLAKEAIELIGELYAIDTALRHLDHDQRYRERQRLLAPKLAAFKRWLDELQPKVLGNTRLRSTRDACRSNRLPGLQIPSFASCL
jgi:transposase